MFLALVTLSLLADVAPGPQLRRPPPPPVNCSADADCMLSTFNGCCGSCCGGDPHAVPRSVNEAARCAVIDCAMPDCSAVKCRQPRPASDFVAACRASHCVAIAKVEAPAQCRINADCAVVTAAPPAGDSCHRSACGCCPVTQAVPVDAVVPLQKRPTGTEAKPGKPNFGLTTGGPTPPPAPNCSPCPGPTGGAAACEAGRCVLQQAQPRPEPRPRPPG